MEWAFDTKTNRVIVNVTAEDTPGTAYPQWVEVLTDPRWKPGVSLVMLSYHPDAVVVTDLLYLNELLAGMQKHGLKRGIMIVRTPEHQEAARMIVKVAKVYDIEVIGCKSLIDAFEYLNTINEEFNCKHFEKCEIEVAKAKQKERRTAWK
jgi:hypothetical protein